MSKRLALGIIDAAAIPRDNLLLAHGMSLGFAWRIKSMAQEGASPTSLAEACDEMIFNLLRLAGVANPNDVT